MAFAGIPPEALEFYEQLEADNTKAFWQANRPTYLEVVKAPVEELCEALPDYGPFHLFRPHNDLRFSKNKPPYKVQKWRLRRVGGRCRLLYFQLSAQRLMCGTGNYAMAKDQLVRLRAAVDAEAPGSHTCAARA